MNERSFFVLKPDAINKSCIFNFIQQKLSIEKLNIIEKKIVTLNEDAIKYMWPFCINDKICFLLLCRYLANQELPLFLVEGENAIKKINVLKQQVREKYAQSYYSNCLHAPRNSREFERDMCALKGEINSKVEGNNDNIIDMFERYKRLADDDLEKSSVYIWEMLHIGKFSEKQAVWLNLKAQWKMELLNDDIHEAVFVIAAIYEWFNKYKLEWIYYTVFSVDFGKPIPLAMSDDFEQLLQAKKYLQQYNIKTKILRN